MLPLLPCTFRLVRICAAVALAAALFHDSVLFPPGSAAQEASRGQRVRARAASGEMLDLYDESHALVVGVSDYNNGWRRLPGVKSDVPAVSAVLKQQGFTVTPLLDPAVEDFERAMRSFISAHGLKERNRLVIYFAGHWHTERLGDDRDLGYIVMRNAPRPDLDPAGFAGSAISMEQMNAYATRIKSKHALFVFDSCFSGSIFRSETSRRPARIESKSAGPVRQFITSGPPATRDRKSRTTASSAAISSAPSRAGATWTAMGMSRARSWAFSFRAASPATPTTPRRHATARFAMHG
ncbi:MAG: caspase family protein [Blastocatellia bacterium]